jgi:hypothetical protein
MTEAVPGGLQCSLGQMFWTEPTLTTRTISHPGQELRQLTPVRVDRRGCFTRERTDMFVEKSIGMPQINLLFFL